MSECKKKHLPGAGAAGFSAGILSGLLGGSGGLLLVPGLEHLAKLPREQIFPSTVAILLPVTAAALLGHATRAPLPFSEALPYLIGGAGGGWLAGKFGTEIPLRWLHRSFGALMIFGGVRMLWP